MKYDFGGYATKNDLKCSDGRTIRKDAFKDCDGKIVPIVWQHFHNDSESVLGHGLLENREDGVYIYGSLNDTTKGKNAKKQILHGDITQLSIWANRIQETSAGDVLHGDIKEVSLVIGGANPGAVIDAVYFSHSDGSEVMSDDEFVLSSVSKIDIEPEKDDTTVKHADDGGETMQDVLDTFSDKQKNVLYAMIAALNDGMGNIAQSDLGGNNMKKNLFAQQEGNKPKEHTLSHAEVKAIFHDAMECGSLKKAVIAHAAEYGIENIDVFFPDAQAVSKDPSMIKRDQGWVTKVLNGAKHVPFSRIKSTGVDITADEARARGYVKGNLKKEEVIKALKRITGPTTIYKKQKLDRDDILDITTMDIVAFLKAEMRLMLNEEAARAALLGDGRDPEAEADDKIDEECIRPIYSDDDMYAHHVALDSATVTTGDQELDEIVKAMEYYEGEGTPSLFATRAQITKWKLLKDKVGRKLFANEDDIASYLGVDELIPVPLMKGMTRKDDSNNTYDLLAIVVNMADYTFGADKGGDVSMFDGFDIDFNQFKYLLETRMSGALTKPKTALVIEKKTNAA